MIRPLIARLSLNGKLMLVILSVTGAALLLVSCGVMLFQIWGSRTQVQRDQEAFAAMIAAGCVSALDFEQPRDAQLFLEGLAQKPTITFAGIYTRNGDLFAAYRRADLPANYVPEFHAERAFFYGPRHYLYQPILSQGEAAGTIVLITDLAAMKNQVRRNLLLLLLVLAVTALPAVMLSSRLGRVISVPITDLAETMSAVSLHQDFSRRAKGAGTDEIGTLVRGFNDMMDRIQAQNQALEEEKRALHASEKKYRGIFENAGEGIFQVDRNGLFLTVNPAFTRMLGYHLASEVLEGVADAARIFQSEGDRERFLHDLQHRGYVRDFETQLTCKDGSAVHVSINAHRVTSAGQARLFFEGTVQDNSQRIRADQLAAAKEQAEAATRSKSAFLANMSHEIRTPMNAVIGLTNLALTQELPPKTREYLGMIHEAGHSLLNVINDILDFSKVEAGKLVLERVGFSLVAICDHLANMFRTTSSLKNIELLFHVDNNLPPRLLGDPLRITQVLTNLINNALKFTEHGEIIVRITLTAIAAEGDGTVSVRFQVSDTGIGIPAAKVATLFDSFTQADESHSRKFGGTGLGLAICKDLVGLMRGHIEVRSTEGVGSAFTFDIPLAVDDTEGTENRRIFAGHEVLVVNAHERAGAFMRRMLHDQGFRVTLCRNLESARAHLSGDRERPRLIIMDCAEGLGETVGFVRRVRRAHESDGLPLIVTAAMDQSAWEGPAREAGADAFLIKPVSRSLLLDTIVNVFQEDYAAGLTDPEQPWQARTPDHIVGASILLVEDNEVNRIVAGDLLRDAGMRVDVVGNGMDAVRAVLAGNYDAVLMDIQMPDMDGYQTTEAIRANPRFSDLPIIAMTAHAMQADRENCLARGMNEHVAKPIHPAALFKALARFVAVPAPLDFDIAPPCLDLPEVPGIHMPQALARIGGNAARLKQILTRFAERFADAAEQIRREVEAGRRDEAGRLLHALKGASGNISANQVYHLASAMELDLAEGGTPVNPRALERALYTVVTGIRRLPADLCTAEPLGVSLEKSLKELAVLLERNDFEAEDLLERIVAEFGEGNAGPFLSEIAAHLRDLNFKTARGVLQRLATAQRIELAPSS